MKKICPHCNRLAENFVGTICEECHDEFDREEAEYYKIIERNQRKRELKR